MAHGKTRQRFRNVHEVIEALTPSYPVYCLRPARLAVNATRFATLFPGTTLYAVKCNPHPLVLDALYAAGIRHFDTASLPEIALVAERFPEAKAYFMHPVKSRAAIQTAYHVYGVRDFVVDHPDELKKIQEETHASDLTIVVRLKTATDAATVYDLSSKFGCDVALGAELMHRATDAGLQVGLAFHVGSQCGTPAAYRLALAQVGETLARAGVMPACIDVGGGFPAPYANLASPPLERYIAEIRAGLTALNLPPAVRILAEPGRALVADTCSLLVQVQLRKDDRLYVNDGVYGSLSEMAVSRIRFPARLVRRHGSASAATMPFTLLGPTCDGLDVLPGTFPLPIDVREGDWLELDQVGAYGWALATRFNGFFPDTTVEIDDP